ncbi:DHH family protein, partial [candidate division WWE3 bacterium]|nr:DHH family protein [candidate division WWE3 bacterium]
MNRIVITSGEVFTDIDALACVVAYAELLKIESKEYCIYLPGKLNHSNTETVKSWNFTFSDTYEPQEGDTFVVMDVSEPDHIAKAVDPERVIEIYDHHFGFADPL